MALSENPTATLININNYNNTALQRSDDNTNCINSCAIRDVYKRNDKKINTLVSIKRRHELTRLRLTVDF